MRYRLQSADPAPFEMSSSKLQPNLFFIRFLKVITPPGLRCHAKKEMSEGRRLGEEVRQAGRHWAWLVCWSSGSPLQKGLSPSLSLSPSPSLPLACHPGKVVSIVALVPRAGFMQSFGVPLNTSLPFLSSFRLTAPCSSH